MLKVEFFAIVDVHTSSNNKLRTPTVTEVVKEKKIDAYDYAKTEQVHKHTMILG